MKQRIQPVSGRLTVTIFRRGKHQVVMVHRLVADAFLGLRPDGCETCHNDGDKLNNRAENLRYAPPSENNADRIAHGVTNRGERNGRAKLTADAVRLIRASSVGHRETAETFGVSPTTVREIRIGKRWSHA